MCTLKILCYVFLTQLFPIFNKSLYTLNDFRPISHGVGCARVWPSICSTWRQINIPPFEPQFAELHGRYIIVTHIEAELLSFGMPN